jgi:GNAT superfamily N-acetyltransferase
MSRVPEQAPLLSALLVRSVGIDDLAVARQLLSVAFKRLSSARYAASDAAAIQGKIDSSEYLDTLRGRALTMAWLHAVPVAVGGWLPGPDGGRMARLGSIGVDPMFSGLGLGRFIVGQVEASARRAGFRDLIVQAPRPLVDFYRALDYASSTPSSDGQAGEQTCDSAVRRTSLQKKTSLHKRLLPPAKPSQVAVDETSWPELRPIMSRGRSATSLARPDRPVLELARKRVPSKTTH